MPGPWEKFNTSGASDNSGSKPWERFGGAETPSLYQRGEDALYGAAKSGLGLLGKVVGPIDNFFGKYISSPIRQTAYDLAEGKPLNESLLHGGSVIGTDTDKVPSGKDIAEKQGFSDTSLSDYFPALYNDTGKGLQLQKGGWADPTAKGLVGGVYDMASDPLTYVSGLGIGKLGAEAGPAVAAVKTAAESIPGVKSAIQGAKGLIKPIEDAAAPIVDSDSQVKNIMKATEPPEGFKGLINLVDEAKKSGLNTELPSAEAFRAAEKNLPDLKFKALPGQKAAVASRQDADVISAFKDLPSKESKAYQDYLALQRNELIDRLNKETNSISKGFKPTDSAKKAGDQLIKDYLDIHNKTKAENIPAFKQIDAVQIPVEDLGNKLGNKIAKDLGIEKYIVTEADAEGRTGIKMLPWQARSGISKGTYDTIAKTLEELNTGGEFNIRDLRNIRESLRDNAEKARGSGSLTEARKIESIRSSLLDYIQNTVESSVPDVKVRQTFKNWAINEQNKEMLTKVLGGKLDPTSLLTDKAVSENALDNVFRNSNTVQLAKQTLGDNFKKAAANYVAQGIESSKTHGVMSAKKFDTWLRNNEDVLNIAFQDNPKTLQQIKSIADYMRLGPDMITSNPSGTAKSVKIMESLTQAKEAVTNPRKFLGEMIANRQVKKEAENLLVPKKPGESIMNKAQGGLLNLDNKAEGLLSNPLRIKSQALRQGVLIPGRQKNE